METYGRTAEQAAKQAKEQGLEPVWGSPKRLTIDLDHGDGLNAEVLEIFLEQEPAAVIERWPSRSGQGEHVEIQTQQTYTVAERAAIQAALGSDPKREILAVYCHRSGKDAEPFVLFKPKPKRKRKPTPLEQQLLDEECPF